jgi:hypothetical protein
MSYLDTNANSRAHICANSTAFFACFVRRVFANIRLSFTAGSGSGLPLTVQRGRQQLRLLGEIKGLHLEVSNEHK